MVGPTVACIERISTPKLRSTSMIRFLLVSCSCLSTYVRPSVSYFLRSSNVGNLYLVNGSRGLIGVSISGLLSTVLLFAVSSPLATSICISTSVDSVSSELLFSMISSVEAGVLIYISLPSNFTI